MRLLALICCLCLGGALQAQQVFDAGVYGGIITSQVNGDNAKGFNKIGFTGGGFVRANLFEGLGVRMEIGYAGKGSRRPSDPDNGDYSSWGYTFHYVDVPILIEFTMSSSLMIDMGPYVGYLISSQGLFDGAEYDIVNPPMENIDAGIAGGIGYEFSSGLFFMSRYSMSVIPIRNFPDPGNLTTYWDGRMANIAIHFTLGYVINGD